MADNWYVIVPAQFQNVSDVSKDHPVIIHVQQGSPADNSLQGGGNQHITYNGQDYARRFGPFATEAQAKKAAPVGVLGLAGAVVGGIIGGVASGDTGTSPVITVPTTSAAGSTAAGSSATGNPLSGLAAIGDFFNRLTDAHTWVRVGEVLLGVILLAIGVAKISGTGNAVTKALGATPQGAAAKAIL